MDLWENKDMANWHDSHLSATAKITAPKSSLLGGSVQAYIVHKDDPTWARWNYPECKGEGETACGGCDGDYCVAFDVY